VQSVQTSAGLPGHWSVLVFYEGAATQGQGPSDTRAAPQLLEVAPDDSARALTPEQQAVYSRLREWRSRRASAEGKPAYTIANNAVLMDIARRHMTIRAVDDLLRISRFGPARAARYGPDILQLLCLLSDNDGAPLFDDER
jgi:superfamily II DNA helicase RecQ